MFVLGLLTVLSAGVMLIEETAHRLPAEDAS